MNKESMCFMTLSDLDFALAIGVFASANESTFIVPPADLSPVRLMVFEELFIELKILTNSENYLFSRNTRLFGGDSLVPLAFTVMECSNRASNINDSTLFSLFIL